MFAELKVLLPPEEDQFCKCLEAVMNDRTQETPQMDELNILEPWKAIDAIDNKELVSLINITFRMKSCYLTIS